jgi:hypothetical protein
MNKIITAIIAILVMITVVSPVYSADPQQELDALVTKWTESLIAEDIEGFLSCYWDDAVRLVYFPGQEPTLVDGIEAMRIEEQKGMGRIRLRVHEPHLRRTDPVLSESRRTNLRLSQQPLRLHGYIRV